MLRKGISPVIATVIIVAVAIAISVAVAGWLFGLWGGFAGGTPQISVSNPTGSASGKYILVYLTNPASGSDNLIDVEIIYGNQSFKASANQLTLYWNNATINTLPFTIPANAKGWLKIDFSNANINPAPKSGEQIQVKLYFEKSSTQQFSVTLGP